MHERRLVVELAAAQTSRELAGTFQVLATAAPGHTLDEVQDAVLEEIERFASEGPTEPEVARGRAQAEAAYIFRAQTLGGFGGKADQLNAYNIYRGTPDYFREDLGRYMRATADDLRAAVSGWIDPKAAVTLSVVPEKRTDLAVDGERVAERGA
jgi:zinc protease